MITLIRRYFSYNIVNSHSYEVNLELTMKITDNQEYLFFPISDYTADLKVVDSSNKELIILSDKEFENKFQITMELMTDVYISDLKQYLGNNYSELRKDHRLIAIMLDGENEYEKIKISWIEKTRITKSDGVISLNYQMPIYLQRYGKVGTSL